jgi:hypothetical protein
MWNFLVPVNGSNLIQRPDIRAETTVHTKDLFVNERRQTKTIKALDTMSPHTGVAVLAQTLIIKSVDLGDLSRLRLDDE